MIRRAVPLDHRWAVPVLALIALLPMALVRVPGMADLPNHIARHHVLAGDSTGLARWFVVGWRWIGNLGVDLPVVALTPWLGVETATRVIVALIAPLTVLGIVALARAAHGRLTAGAMLALPFAMAQPWMYGFVNYCLGVALALIVAAAWIGWQPRSAIVRSVAFAVAALAVWTAHIQGWAVLLILVAGAELAQVVKARDLVRRTARALPLMVPLVPMLAWRSGGPGLLWSYDRHVLFAKAMDFVTVLKGSSPAFDLAETAIIGLAALAALACAGRPAVDRRLAVGAVLLLLATMLLPTTVLGSWGADLRLAPVAIVIALLAIAPAADPRRERALVAIGIALFVVRVAAVTVVWSRADGVLARRLTLLDAVPRGSRMGYVSLWPDCRTPWTLTPERKLGAYAVTRRDAFSNTSFQIDGADLMTIRAPADRVRWRDQSQDIERICPGDRFDRARLEARLADMARDGFTSIWIAGLHRERFTLPAGYAVTRATGQDLLIQRR